jgi:hypothetical protein
VETQKNISQGSWSVDRDYSKVNPWLDWAALMVQLSCLVSGTTKAAPTPTKQNNNSTNKTTTTTTTTKANTGYQTVN